MATKYSSFYGANPSDSTNYIYKGPHPMRTGDMLVRQCTFVGVFSAATADVIKICKLSGGEKIVGFANGRLADPDALNDLTVNIGMTSAPTAIAAASIGMQGTAKLVFDAGDLAGIAAALETDELLVTPAAGAAEVSTTHYFTVYSHVPQG